MPARSRRSRIAAAASGVAAQASSQRSGRNSRQDSGQDAVSVTAEIDTPTWQLPTLPSVPEYCRATPGEAVPSLTKPVSSTTHACGPITPTAWRPHPPARPGGQPLPHRLHRPGGGGEELLQPLMIDTQPLGHRLHRLAPPVPPQSAHVRRALVPLIAAGQRREHLRRELLQPPPYGGQLPRSHASIAPRGRSSGKS